MKKIPITAERLAILIRETPSPGALQWLDRTSTHPTRGMAFIVLMDAAARLLITHHLSARDLTAVFKVLRTAEIAAATVNGGGKEHTPFACALAAIEDLTSKHKVTG